MTNSPNEWHRIDGDEWFLEQAADRDEHDRDRTELHGDEITDRAELAAWIKQEGGDRAAVEQAADAHLDGGWRTAQQETCTHALTSLWPNLDTVPAEWRGRNRCAFCGLLDPKAAS